MILKIEIFSLKDHLVVWIVFHHFIEFRLYDEKMFGFLEMMKKEVAQVLRDFDLRNDGGSSYEKNFLIFLRTPTVHVIFINQVA